MQVPWAELSAWLQTSSTEEVAAPFVRLFALVIAYWMFVSTSLLAIARLSRIPAAIRATSMLALPSVRRVCEGAVAVSLVTSSFVGLAGVTASAQPRDYALEVSNNDLSVSAVDSPTPKTTVDADPADEGAEETWPGMAEAPAGAPASGDADDTDKAAEEAVEEAPTSTTTEAPAPTTSTTAPPTTAAPGGAAQQNTPIAPSAGDDYVLSPRPGKPAVSAPATTTTTVKPADPAPVQPETEVKGTQEHRVVSGDNLWTISRDSLAGSTNRDVKDLSEAEIREYWLKVIEDNRNNLRSGDPHWIFPGEVITLPLR